MTSEPRISRDTASPNPPRSATQSAPSGILRGVHRKSARVGPNLHLSRHQRQAGSSHIVRISVFYLCFEFRWCRDRRRRSGQSHVCEHSVNQPFAGFLAFPKNKRHHLRAPLVSAPVSTCTRWVASDERQREFSHLGYLRRCSLEIHVHAESSELRPPLEELSVRRVAVIVLA